MKAAVLQINSGADRDRNIEVAGDLLRAAVADGAEFVVLPEKWPLLGDGKALTDGAETLDGEAISAARFWAADHQIFILAGSFTELSEDGLPTNTSVMITPAGQIMARYRKIHMFDVEAGGVQYRESAHERAGSELAMADLGELQVGLTICYDLRFPELFRALLDQGANAFTVPSAFTSATGRDHWETLLRARAIENQAFVLAANQVGTADPSYDSWGHSMIIDPWGEILAVVEEGEGHAVADLDLARQKEVRTKLPAVEHRRPEIFNQGVVHGS